MDIKERTNHVRMWFEEHDVQVPEDTITGIASLQPRLVKEEIGMCIECSSLNAIYKIKWDESNTRYWYGCQVCFVKAMCNNFDLWSASVLIENMNIIEIEGMLPDDFFDLSTKEFSHCAVCDEKMLVKDENWGYRYALSSICSTTATVAIFDGQYDASKYEYKKVSVHQSCAKECNGCRQSWLKLNNGNMRVFWFTIDRRDYCIKCFDHIEYSGTLQTCEMCGDDSMRDFYYSDRSDMSICTHCYNMPIECHDCGAEVFERDLQNNDHVCSPRRYIKSYGYKPRPKFFGNASYHMGFELEVEHKDRETEDLDDYDSDGNDSPDLFPAAKYAVEMLGSRAYLKSDGSLSCGFEIVTHPHSLLEYQTNFPWEVLEGLTRKRMISWNTDTCGLHIHVGRVAFDPSSRDAKDSHQIRFLKLIYDNERQVTRLAGRISNYARFNDRGKLVPKIKYGQQQGRYAAVNVENEATLEVRVFKGSLKKERVLAQLEFVHSAVEYTRNLRVVPKDYPFAWSRYVGYVANNNTTYPNLFQLINKLFAMETAVTGD